MGRWAGMVGRVVCMLVLAGPMLAQATACTDEEVAVVVELNRIRMNPRAYARWLKEELRPHLDGRLWRLPGRKPLLVQEGAAALDEAIAYLEKVPPAPPLKVDEGLARAARDHVRDQGPSGQTGHRGTQGGRLTDRLAKHGSFRSVAGEIINYGTEKPRFTVIQLVIDDGVPDRGHRKAIFNPEFRLAGPAIGPHEAFGSMTVVDLADGFTAH